MSFLAGPKGLEIGDELTFFYPSSEWTMAQPFNCFCGASNCRGRIDGAGKMSAKQLEGLWLNGYIRDMIAERDEAKHQNGNGTTTNGISKKVAGTRGVTSRELSGEMGGDTVPN